MAFEYVLEWKLMAKLLHFAVNGLNLLFQFHSNKHRFSKCRCTRLTRASIKKSIDEA